MTTKLRTRPIRRRRRRDTEPVPIVVARGLATAAVLGVLGYFAISLYSGVPGRDYTYVDAVVPETASLIPHDPVRIGGVRVGQVMSIKVDARGRGRLRLQLEEGTRLPEDTRIRIRGSGLLGARFVELIPGRSRRTLPAGTPIRGDERSLTYGATDALDTFDRETRGALHALVGELGEGLAGRGAGINEALRLGSDAIVRFRVLMDRLLAQPQANEALLPSLERGLRPLHESRRELSRLFGPAADAVGPFADRREAVQATLDGAPEALDAANRGLGATRGLLSAARSLAAELRTTLPPAPEALRTAAVLLRESRRPLADTAGLLRAAEPAVPPTLRVTSLLDRVLPHLDGVVTDLTPMSRLIGRYECDIENFGAVFRSMTGFGTRNGQGPGGPAMQFRLQAIAPVPTSAVSLKDVTGLVRREGLPEPCKYLSKPYTIVELPGRGVGQ